MSKLVFISNRLPVTVERKGEGLQYKKSIGGLATGLKNYHAKSDSLWVGWPGIVKEELNDEETREIAQTLTEEYNCKPVFLSRSEIEEYYLGFCNKAIWPLFHYFSDKAEYHSQTWEMYKKVNQRFFADTAPFIEDGDTIWVHDYQLMLLPQLIREKYPNTRIGFFLHIPFPSFEIFRLLIWRVEILKGLLGADLVGFHTYDYVRHFLSSAKRLLGLDHTLNKIDYEDRYVQVDAFPMGIDYQYFTMERSDEQFLWTLQNMKEEYMGIKVISSVDRLDYTKGIPNKIIAFGTFLENNPQYIEKIRLNLIVAPSRTEVDTYEDLRREITELVSEVNGRYSTTGWIPIWFYFQSFSQEYLIALYKNTDVMLVTPLRDGMNLVAKEYIAARTDYEGMLVISETAGAASELGEAVIVNPNDNQATAAGIKMALDMPQEEINVRNKIMHERLKHYNVNHWADEFIETLHSIDLSSSSTVYKNLEQNLERLGADYINSQRRLLFLDYDGTLVGFKDKPQWAKPDQKLKDLLSRLAANPKNTVVIVSGRDRLTLENWLGDLDLHLLADHGLWLKSPQEEWRQTIIIGNEWKGSIRNLLKVYHDRLPGSLIEEKEFSLAFHYRQCDPYMIEIKLGELREELLSQTSSLSVGLQEGKKVIEVKDSRINKGLGVNLFLQDQDFDFIFGAGDDLTDEDLFAALPQDAYRVKVGIGNTEANYIIKSWESMRFVLENFVQISNLHTV